MNEQSAAELLMLITWQETDQERKQAEHALNEFFHRYGDYCKLLAYALAGENKNMYEDIYRIFIHYVWKKADKYDDSRVAEEPNEEKRIKAWLSSRKKAILRWYWKELTDGKAARSLDDITRSSFEPAADDKEILGDIEIKDTKLKIALIEGKILTKRELDILNMSYQFGGKIPKYIRQEICKEYGINDNTIRTIRYRAMKKLKEFMKEWAPA